MVSPTFQDGRPLIGAIFTNNESVTARWVDIVVAVS